MKAVIHIGDCREVLATMPDASVHAVVCDPPYGIGFMGMAWDTMREGGQPRSDAAFDHVGGNHNGTSAQDAARTRRIESVRFGEWCRPWLAEVFRVLRPGGHLVAFGGTRTHHRMWCAIEDAGFEIRDSLFYLYAQGFPKSHNLHKLDCFCRCDAVPYENGIQSQDMRGVRRHVGASNSVSSGAQSHLLDGVLAPNSDVSPNQGGTESDVRGLREDVSPSGESSCNRQDADVLSTLQWEIPGSGLGQACPQGFEGQNAGELCGCGDARCPKSGVEGRRDDLQKEGELRGGAVSAGAGMGTPDGAQGRVCHGASPGNGSDVRPSPLASGSGQPQGQESSEQRSVESGIVPDERGSQAGGGWPICSGCGKPRVPNGLGTALKPSVEPICLARKPLSESSVAKNVLRWGTGALNIDGCRIEATDGYTENAVLQGINTAQTSYEPRRERRTFEPSNVGRWPANVCLDEEAAAMLDAQSGERTSGQPCGTIGEDRNRNTYGSYKGGIPLTGYGDTGGASRFFFTAKPSVEERESGLAHITPRTRNRVNSGGLENDPKWAPTTRRNTHPTVKPFDLMSWLVRLVTPPSGIVCDPFLGSGTTGMAAVAEGFDFIGIERDAGFAEIAEGRIRNVAPLLIATKIHTTAEPGSLSGSVEQAATSDTSGPKPGTAGVRSPGGD